MLQPLRKLIRTAEILFNKLSGKRYLINLFERYQEYDSIKKEINLHSLRHSYATHLLEDGVNIVTLKELLGHAQITTTMIYYLHVAQCPLIKPHNPLDTLYGEKE